MKKSALVVLLVGGAFSCLANAAARDCPENPYAIKTAGGKLTVAASLPPKLVGTSAKPTDGSVDAVLQFSRTMYAAMAPTVVDQVLQVYTCWVEQAIDADETKTEEQRNAVKDAWQHAVLDLNDTTAQYFTAYVAKYDMVAQLSPAKLKVSMSADDRSPAPYLVAIKNENFLVEQAYEGWLRGSIKGISATACGTYLRRALAANAGSIQYLAASVRPVLVNYFSDRKLGVNVAKSMLYSQAASALLVTPPTGDEAVVSLKACSGAGAAL